MGRLMVEANEKMEAELRWDHLLKRSMPPNGSKDYIELNLDDTLELPVEQFEINPSPTLENDHVLELKSLELSKESYGASNDNLTIYND